MPKIILASASPQRFSLLKGLDIEFTVVPSTIAEAECTEREPRKRAQILARLKAEDVAKHHSDSVVIGCDTLVVSHRGTLLEKPKDEKEARMMLEEQKGSTSTVHSALCLIEPKTGIHEALSSSSVFFKTLTEQEIDWWVSTNLWKDRSGAFQIDGPGQLMIKRIDGDWTGIVGLPVFLLGQLLRDAGIAVA